MPVNSLTFNQLSTLLNGIASQATGATGIAPVNTNEFVSVAQTTLLAGADPVMSAISQILGRTIFSIRPYNAKFRGLLMDNQRWGGITRKINYVDKSFTNDSGFALTDGEAIDQYTVNKPEVVQTNYYGSNIYQKSITIFRDQLDTAFSGVDQFAEFIGGVTQNISDQIEQAHENTARMTIANLVTGIIAAAKANQIVHLLTEYNAATGFELTSTTVYTPANFKPFMQWVYSRIAQVSSMLTERSQTYHFNLTGKPIQRHSPYDRQRLYLYAAGRYQSEAQVLADTYHDNYLRFGETETVNFWQSIEKPDQIQAKPCYLKEADGTVITTAQNVTQANVFAVMMDEEAAGMNIFNYELSSTPYNARGRYNNLWWSFNERYFNDFTENAVVFLLD